MDRVLSIGHRSGKTVRGKEMVQRWRAQNPGAGVLVLDLKCGKIGVEAPLASRKTEGTIE